MVTEIIFDLKSGAVLNFRLTRIMSRIFISLTHTNNTYRCHKVTALAKDVTSNLLGGETHDCISNVLSLTLKFTEAFFDLESGAVLKLSMLKIRSCT